jgi:hypothetical protein
MIDDQSRNTYLNILAEIKHRLEAVRQVLDGNVPIPAKVAEELCILQFRFVSELIAIGCLVLHKDITLSSSGVLAKAWNAGQIFKRLTILHSDFYPKPLRGNILDKYTWEAFTGQYMTKDKIIAAYNREFGAALHRGTARRIFRDDPPLDFPKVRHMAPIGEHPICSLFKRLPNGLPAIE